MHICNVFLFSIFWNTFAIFFRNLNWPNVLFARRWSGTSSTIWPACIRSPMRISAWSLCTRTSVSPTPSTETGFNTASPLAAMGEPSNFPGAGFWRSFHRVRCSACVWFFKCAYDFFLFQGLEVSRRLVWLSGDVGGSMCSPVLAEVLCTSWTFGRPQPKHLEWHHEQNPATVPAFGTFEAGTVAGLRFNEEQGSRPHLTSHNQGILLVFHYLFLLISACIFADQLPEHHPCLQVHQAARRHGVGGEWGRGWGCGLHHTPSEHPETLVSAPEPTA